MVSFSRLLPESFGFLITMKKAKQAEKWVDRTHRWGGAKFECDVLKTIENETARLPEDASLKESLREYFIRRHATEISLT